MNKNEKKRGRLKIGNAYVCIAHRDEHDDEI